MIAKAKRALRANRVAGFNPYDPTVKTATFDPAAFNRFVADRNWTAELVAYDPMTDGRYWGYTADQDAFECLWLELLASVGYRPGAEPCSRCHYHAAGCGGVCERCAKIVK